MKHEFVIDGTDIICNLSDEPTLAPLLQLLIILQERKYPFYCYFDADTRYKFSRDIDKQLYQSIIKFGLNDCFNQATGGDADRLILKQANDIHAPIITTNAFKNVLEDYLWLQENKPVLKPEIIDNQFFIKDLNIVFSLENDVKKLAIQLMTALEAARDNLHGTIDRYKDDRDFGFIRRNIGDKKLFFHKKAVEDSSINFTTPDTPVSFQFDINHAGGIYYFCAVAIKKRTVSPAQIVQQLAADREKLTASKEFLQQQAIDLKTSFEREMQELSQRNQNLQFENHQLKEQLDLYTNSETELTQRIKEERNSFKQELKQLQQVILEKDSMIEGLRKEIEFLKSQRQAALEALEQKVAESNLQAVTIDFQEEKISNLDEDLKAALRLVQLPQLNNSEAVQFERLKEEYNVLLNAIGQKNSQIAFLNNNLQDLQKQLEHSNSPIAQNHEIEQLIEKVNDLEVKNKSLKTQIEQLEILTNNTPLSIDNQQIRNINPSNNEPKTQQQNHPSTVVTLSDDAKKQRKAKPQRIIIEATKTELENWWESLEDQWKISFNKAVLSRGEVLYIPDEDQLRSIFKRKKIDLVGSGILLFGLNQLSFKLTNLSGLRELTQIEELNISGHDVTNLEGLEHLEKLDFLNCTSNKITSLKGIENLSNLKTLIIQDNELATLDGAEYLTQLEYFNCLYNGTLKTISNVKTLTNLQVFCVDDYKTVIRLELETLEKAKPNLEIRNV